MNHGYHQSYCASCRQCLCCRLRRNCQCTPLPVLDWSRDHTRDGALDFRKKKLSRQNNARDLPAMKQHLTRENPQVEWNSMDEIVVNLCMNCDRKWRKFRDGYLHEHQQQQDDQASGSGASDLPHLRPLTTPEPSHLPPPPPPATTTNTSYEPEAIINRPLVEHAPHELSPEIPTSRKRRRRETVMSELHQLTSSNFGKL